MAYDYGFDNDKLNALYDSYYHGEDRGRVEATSTEPVFVTSQQEFMDWNANAGFPLWLEHDDLVFLFQVRYSSPAFTRTFIQEDYRIRTHAQFSSLIKDIVTQKLEAMRGMPSLYEDVETDSRRVIAPDFIDKDNVLEIAYGLGVDPARIDVSTVVSDVASSLEDMLVRLLKWHPHMTPADKRYAADFIDAQLWDDTAKQLWRAVSAEKMADLFDYRMVPRGVEIIQALDSYARDEFQNGAFQAYDLENADLDSLLNDDVIDTVIEALEDNDRLPEKDRLNSSWVIQDAIATGQDDYEFWWG